MSDVEPPPSTAEAKRKGLEQNIYGQAGKRISRDQTRKRVLGEIKH